MRPEILLITPEKNFIIISVGSSMLLLSAGCVSWVLFLLFFFFAFWDSFLCQGLQYRLEFKAADGLE